MTWVCCINVESKKKLKGVDIGCDGHIAQIPRAGNTAYTSIDKRTRQTPRRLSNVYRVGVTIPEIPEKTTK